MVDAEDLRFDVVETGDTHGDDRRADLPVEFWMKRLRDHDPNSMEDEPAPKRQKISIESASSLLLVRADSRKRRVLRVASSARKPDEPVVLISTKEGAEGTPTMYLKTPASHARECSTCDYITAPPKESPCVVVDPTMRHGFRKYVKVAVWLSNIFPHGEGDCLTNDAELAAHSSMLEKVLYKLDDVIWPSISLHLDPETLLALLWVSRSLRQFILCRDEWSKLHHTMCELSRGALVILRSETPGNPVFPNMDVPKPFLQRKSINREKALWDFNCRCVREFSTLIMQMCIMSSDSLTGYLARRDILEEAIDSCRESNIDVTCTNSVSFAFLAVLLGPSAAMGMLKALHDVYGKVAARCMVAMSAVRMCLAGIPGVVMYNSSTDARCMYLASEASMPLAGLLLSGDCASVRLVALLYDVRGDWTNTATCISVPKTIMKRANEMLEASNVHGDDYRLERPREVVEFVARMSLKHNYAGVNAKWVWMAHYATCNILEDYANDCIRAFSPVVVLHMQTWDSDHKRWKDIAPERRHLCVPVLPVTYEAVFGFITQGVLVVPDENSFATYG